MVTKPFPKGVYSIQVWLYSVCDSKLLLVEIVGNLSTDIFEPWTATANWRFNAVIIFNVPSSHRRQNKSFFVRVEEQNHTKKEPFYFWLLSVRLMNVKYKRHSAILTWDFHSVACPFTLCFQGCGTSDCW